MRYTGPLGKAFSGDKQRAQSLQSRARVVVGRLLYALKRQGGIGQQYGTERQPDGSVIHAMVMRMIAGQEPIIRTWIESPTRVSGEEIEVLRGFPTYWLESSFIEPSRVLVDLLEFADEKTAHRVDDAVFHHNARSKIWSNWDPEDLGFSPRPNGNDLVAMSQPLSLGYAKPEAQLTYTEAVLRAEKATAYFGNWTVYEDYLTRGLGSGSHTGKMVLYHRAKLGALLGAWKSDDSTPLADAVARFYQERIINEPNALGIGIGHHNAIGLITNSDNEYWIATITESNSITFHKLFVFPKYLSAVLRHHPDSKERLFAEAYALGYSQWTNETRTVAITADFDGVRLDYRPIAYSWHFNWEGSEAILVGHKPVGAKEGNRVSVKEFDTRVFKMRITADRDGANYVFSAHIVTDETAQWSHVVDYQSDVFYVPKRGGSDVRMGVFSGLWPASVAFYGYPGASDTPIYAYYSTRGGSHRNLIPSVIRYTRSRKIQTEVKSNIFYDMQGYYFCDDVYTGLGERWAGVSQEIGFSSPFGTVYEAQDYYVYGKRWATAENTGTINTIVENRGGSSAILTETVHSSDGCGQAISHPCAPNPGDSSVSFVMTTHYWQPTITYFSYDEIREIPSASIVVPSDCAEGFLLISRAGNRNSNVTRRFVDSPTPSIKYVEYSDVRSQPSNTSLFGGNYLHGYGGADFSMTEARFSSYALRAKTILCGRNGAIDEKVDSQEVSGDYPPEVDVLELPYVSISGESEIGYGFLVADMPELRVCESFGGEVFVKGTQKYVFNGFPEAFLSTTRPPEIIGSI